MKQRRIKKFVLSLTLLMATGAPLCAELTGSAGDGEPGQTMPAKVRQAIERLQETQNPIVLQTALKAIADRYPQRVVLETYGLSRAGRSLHRLRILPWNESLESYGTEQPTVAIVADLQHPADPALVLRWAFLRASLGKHAGAPELVIYPLPDPDAWVRGTQQVSGPGSVCLQRNFPSAWSPWLADGQNPGSAPLSEPEARALAHSLKGMPRGVALLRLASSKLNSVSNSTPNSSQPGVAGSLQRYAAKTLGLIVADTPEVGSAAWDRALLRIEDQRPSLAAQVLHSKRLSQELWMVDLALENTGQRWMTPKSSGKSSSITWQVSAATQLASAWASQDASSPFQLMDNSRGLYLPAAGKSVRLRLVLLVPDGQKPQIKFSSSKLSGTSLAIDLQPLMPTPR